MSFGVVHTPQAKRELGSRIKSARLRAGLSLDKLGLRVGTSRQHLIRLESGQHAPAKALLARIAAETNAPGLMESVASDDDEDESDVPPFALEALATTTLADLLLLIARGTAEMRKHDKEAA